MKFQGIKFLLATFLLFGISIGLNAQADEDIARKPVPDYRGLVNDFAGVLTQQEVAALETNLRAYEDSTSTQIVVVTEKTLNGRDQFDRSMDFARQWGVGQKDKNNGVVIYLAIEDRKLSIRTANATQGALTDGETGEIRRNAMQPLLKQGRYFEALDSGTRAVMLALAGEFKSDGKGKNDDAPGWIMIAVVLLIILLMSAFGKRGRNRGYGGMGPYFWGGGFGGGFGGGSSSGSSWGGMGGGGGFDGGGSDGGW
ncbi:MAG: TPM domain-containing protein [Sphingomonadales bacterium]|jgi:uncharacterized protein